MDKNIEKHLKSTQDQLKLTFDATQEFFNMWTKNYQSTFGKIAQVPAFGPVREKQEKMMKGIPICMDLYTTWIDSNINFQGVLMEAMKKVYEETMCSIKEDNSCANPEKYKELYKTWIDTYSETFKEFMKSEHFASDMGKFASLSMDFQEYNKEIIEANFLKPNNLPTKTDIDEINKELYDLKKLSKDLSQQIKDLSKAKESPKEDIQSTKVQSKKVVPSKKTDMSTKKETIPT